MPAENSIVKGQTFLRLAVAAFGLILLSFVLLGFGRTVIDYRTARYLSAPTLFLGAAIVVVLFVQSVLTVLGVTRLD